MRILHTADWHLGKSLENINRIEEQREFIDVLCKIADEQNIDLVLVAGDIYDTYNPSAAAEELFYEAIDRLNDKGNRAVVVIAGNHDNPERLCAASPLAGKRGIILLGYPGSDARGEIAGITAQTGHINSEELTDNRANPGENSRKTGSKAVRIVDSGPGWLELSVPGCEHNAVIITMPYPSESRLEELLTREADEEILQKAYSDKIGSILASHSSKFRDDTVNLIVAHLFMLGGSTSDSERTLQVGGAMTVNPDVMPEKAHYAALGHLHRPQEVRNAPCPVFYAGSPLAYSFSEADYSKAVYVVEALPGQKAVVTPVYLDCGRPLKKWFACEGIGQVIKWCEEGRDRNAWVDLEIATDRILTVEEQTYLRSLHPGIVNIHPRLKTQEAEITSSQSREGRKIDELFRDFYRYRMGTDIPDELMKAFIEILNYEDSDEDENNDNADRNSNSITNTDIVADGRYIGKEGEVTDEAEAS